MSIFSNHQTRIKLNQDTYIKFDGTEKILLHNIYGQQSISIKYDILLILYDLINWTKIEDLLAPWPPNDQQTILEHLEGFHREKIIIDEQSNGESGASESGLSANLGSNLNFGTENHLYMLKDYIRLSTYRQAIERAVTPESVVMDLGCGTGILSFLAARAGAQKVYSIEKRTDILQLAQQIAETNGLSDKIDFIEGNSSQIKEARLTPKPNVFVSEILGSAILEESVLEFTLDARDRFLAPGAKMIPGALEIYIFAYDGGMHRDYPLEIDALKDLYGFDYTPLAEVMSQKLFLRTDRYNTAINKTMSEPIRAKTIDFHTFQSPTFVEPVTLKALDDGQISGFCAYFKAFLDEQTILTNSPWAPQTHWTQLQLILPTAMKVQKGQELHLQLIYDGSIRLQMVENA